MKKILFFTFALALSLLCLFSCASDVTIYSKEEEIKPSLIIADLADTAESEAYNTLCDAITEVLGRSGFYSKTDVYLEAAGEIIIGNTNRTATAKANEVLSASFVEDGDTAAYAYYCHNGSIAIVANSDFALQVAVDRFIESYIVGEALVIKSDFVEVKTFSITAYYAALDAELSALSDAKFEARWDEAMAKIGPEATAALQRLYEFYGTDWATWIYNLYDPDTGCFYYSNSARDYDGFLVDLESTNQALSLLVEAGLLLEFGNDWTRALPLSMREKCLEYVQSMQDPDDGYFYHPQWGDKIDSSRRGRDLDSALGLIRRLGGEPLYDTALDNLGGASGTVASVVSSFMESEEHKSTVVAVADERFESEEGMLNYLNALVASNTNREGYFDSFAFGHILSSETRQIIAAGLGEFVCDYIDTLQNPETGFFEELNPNNSQAGYNAASGVIKISAFYSAVNGAIKHGDKMLDSIIDIILDDVRTSNVTYVFNPWGALASAVGSIKYSNKAAISAGGTALYDETKLMQKIYTKLPALIDATISKLSVYKHDDGSYSFLDDGTSLVNNQGVITSLGYNEGDVNGTACAIHYIIDAIFGCIDLKLVPMLKYSDYVEFRDTVEAAGTVVKLPAPAPELLDFEDGDLPVRVTHDTTNGGASVEIVDAERGGTETKALSITSVANKSLSTCVEVKNSHQRLQCFTLSFDLYVDSADTGPIYQIFLQNTNQNNWYAYMLDISAAGGAVYIRDNESNDSNPKNNPKDLEITEKLDTWFNLKIEYYVLEDEQTGKTTAKIKVYKNGVCAKVSDNYFVNTTVSIAANNAYLKDSTGTVPKPSPIVGVNRVEFLARLDTASKIMIDNIDCIPSTSAIFSDADVVPGAGAMVEPDTVENTVIDFEDGVADPTLFTSEKDGVFSVASKATVDNADNLAYKFTSLNGSSQVTAVVGMETTLIKKSVFTFEADVCVDDIVSKAGNGCFQIAFGDAGTHAFLLELDVTDSDRVRLTTWSSFSAETVVDLGVDAGVGEWFNLKIEYYPVSDDEAHIVAYVNGTKTGESDSYYKEANKPKPVVTKINAIHIMDRASAEASLYLDNIKCSYDATKSYTPAQ